jgi:cytochrome P450
MTAVSLVDDAHRFLGDPAFRQDHEREFYEALHATGPVHPIGNGLWLVCGYREVESAARDVRFSREIQSWTEMAVLDQAPSEEVRYAGACIHQMLLAIDPPEHTRVRKLLRAPFMPRTIEQWLPTLQGLCDELADALPVDGVVDVKERFALPLPARAICVILGVPYEDHALWEAWTAELIAMDRTGHAPEEALVPGRDAHVAFTRYFDDLIERRRAAPGDDLLSALVTAEEDGDRLTNEELIGNFTMLVAAGHETTASTTCNALVLLMGEREQWEMVVADPTLAGAAIEETLRLESANRFGPPRVARRDVELGGHVVPEGDKIILMFNAADCDPSVFPDPFAFDLTRPARPHLGFGSGQHLCLGMHLARLEMVTALETLVARFPEMELAVDPSQLRRIDAPTIRAWDSLPMRLAPSR